MSIQDLKFGKHENVKWLEFGTGDIMFSPGKENIDSKDCLLMFSQAEAGEIAREIPSIKGKSSDELDNIKVVFKFTDPKSITALIHSLIELQEEML
jgi:hypothetical protein